MARKYEIRHGQKGSALAVRVTPRASRNSIAGVQADGTIRVHLTAPPVEDRANRALIEYLAEVLEIPRSRVEIVAGTTGRDKLVSILDMDAQTAQRKILARLQ